MTKNYVRQVEVLLDQRESDALAQMAKEMEMSESRVLIRALAELQLRRCGVDPATFSKADHLKCAPGTCDVFTGEDE